MLGREAEEGLERPETRMGRACAGEAGGSAQLPGEGGPGGGSPARDCTRLGCSHADLERDALDLGRKCL